jgi:vacuolar protein sorting-associated protein 13A/C
VILVNSQTQLATLSLSTADVTVLLRSNTMRITGRLGSLALSNDSQTHVVLPKFKQILSIEGNDFAEFRYQTFDPNEESYTGVKSSVYLSAASVKCHFLEQPLHDIYLFLVKLAKLKGLYDAATQVAVQRASEIERMQFQISVKSPILIFPSNPAESHDVLIMRLGEISARNSCEAEVNRTTASLRGIRLASTIYYDEKPSLLKIIDDIGISADIVQTGGINRGQDVEYPDTQVLSSLLQSDPTNNLDTTAQIAIQVSDVKLYLTKVQYLILFNLSKSIPRVLAGAPVGYEQTQSVIPDKTSEPTRSTSSNNDEILVGLEPELRMLPSTDGNQIWNTIDLVVTIGAVKMHMYDGSATTDSELKDHGIARFALNDSTLRFKMLSDGAQEAQLIVKFFTMSNTMPGNTKFREIIPAAQHDRDQFMLLYTMSGGASGNALAILTVDSPQIIFAIDPVFALLEFFTITNQAPESVEEHAIQDEEPVNSPRSLMVDFRIDLHDVSVNVLENDVDPASEYIRLTINQILLSQQVPFF